jgi:hypothetical protein
MPDEHDFGRPLGESERALVIHAYAASAGSSSASSFCFG